MCIQLLASIVAFVITTIWAGDIDVQIANLSSALIAWFEEVPRRLLLDRNF
jgi:hypothetical protein